MRFSCSLVNLQAVTDVGCVIDVVLINLPGALNSCIVFVAHQHEPEIPRVPNDAKLAVSMPPYYSWF